MSKEVSEKDRTEVEIAGMILNLGCYLFLFWLFTILPDIFLKIVSLVRDVNSFSESSQELLRVGSKVIVPVLIGGVFRMLCSDHFKKILNRKGNIRVRFGAFLGVIFLTIFIYLRLIQ